jgi:TatA/E family protein of Tat protein translocase
MIIFGVGRLPEIGGAMGKAIREFRSSVSGAKGDDPEDQEAIESGMESGKKS